MEKMLYDAIIAILGEFIEQDLFFIDVSLFMKAIIETRLIYPDGRLADMDVSGAEKKFSKQLIKALEALIDTDILIDRMPKNEYIIRFNDPVFAVREKTAEASYAATLYKQYLQAVKNETLETGRSYFLGGILNPKPPKDE